VPPEQFIFNLQANATAALVNFETPSAALDAFVAEQTKDLREALELARAQIVYHRAHVSSEIVEDAILFRIDAALRGNVQRKPEEPPPSPVAS
jgi:hypothetical protein